ncbi:hypothetical protein QVD17_04179 [Tagetes erecta]|uniref:non-specific serine/threonine protein kinase n=1 Tax=Tagetes erecta TaxID=13708 RepID=A0AAD8LG68_TARER|nr:hypothetical protein QVD17_04179 [Tagetes erecta]
MLSMVHSTYPNCSNSYYNCGNINITYPFWRVDDESTSSGQFCGYEGFGINCSANNNRTELPIINLGSALYFVQNINYNASVLSLVDYDVFNIINGCPRLRHTIDLGTLPFKFSESNVNISFHFNCTGYPGFDNAIPCLDSGTRRKSSVNVMDSETEKFDWSVYSCDEEVVMAVLREEIYVSGSNDQGIDYVRGLHRGFELKWWVAEDCSKCEESKGRCGRNNYRKTDQLLCFCSDGTRTNQCNKDRGDNRMVVKVVFGVGVPLLSIVVICTICYINKFSVIAYIPKIKLKCEDHISVEAFIKQYGSLTTKRYTYADAKKMTNSFQVKLGGGGFGTVYQGKLSDGRLVAVKLLNLSRATGKDFINEVASIGKISHINIVSLLGFCSDNHKRALIYEFMPNGSLEKFIQNHNSQNPSIQLSVMKLYEVALGIARGLEYLHRECNPHVLHLDIKPANILLDENFCPKIADFGLAKLYSRNESTVSMMEARGTIGYISPEVFDRNIGGVSHKSDVYSYGMLILEMVGGNKNVDVGGGSKSTSDTYFPDWIYNRLEKNEYVFEGILSEEENEYIRKMMIVGLWCIQTVPTLRPSISEVIEMLEGSIEALEVPQKPSFPSPFHATIISYSPSQSEQESSYLKGSYES